MFKMFGRFSCIVLSFCLFMSLFACGNTGMKLSAEAEKIVSTEKITFVDSNGNAVFRITRPDEVSLSAGPSAVGIFKAYKEKYNTAPKQVTDAESGDGVREILVGNCNREATKKAQQLFSVDSSGKESDFLICSIGDDIVILGGCDKALLSAGEYFEKNILPKKHENGIYYHHKGKEGTMTVCNISSLSKFTVVRPIYNVSYITQLETDKLCELLYTKTGYEVKLKHDSIAVDNPDSTARGGLLETTDATEYEIIIGNCDREGVNKIDTADNYEIRIEDKKIYLNGGSPYATAMAVSEFIKLVEDNDVIEPSMSVKRGSYLKVIHDYDKKTYYRPTWKDEFNGADIDETKWYIAWNARGGTSVDGKPCYRGNPELKNNYVKDGKLYIEAVKTEDAYYGGMLKTDRSMEFLYGYLEISDIHPKGNGFWTALWTLSKSGRYNKDMWHSETDVDEAFGNGESIVGNLWAWPTSYGRNQLKLNNGRSDTVKDHGSYASTDSRGLWMDFHTYGLEWIDNKTIRFTIDGYVWRETVMEEPELQTAYSQYMYLQVSMATAFDTMGLPTQDEWQWENSNKFIVDWIYLYQLEGQKLMKH